MRENDFAVLFYIPETNEKTLKQVLNFTRFADYPTAVVYDKSLLPTAVNAERALILLRKFDDGEKTIEFTEDFSDNFVRQFINSHRYPIVPEFD